MFIYTSQNMGLCNFYYVIVYNEPAIKFYYYIIIVGNIKDIRIWEITRCQEPLCNLEKL